MKHALSPITFCILACASTGRARASDDFTVVSNVTTNGKPSGPQTQYISSGHIRSSHGSGTEVIINLKTGVTRKVAGFACEEWSITMSGFGPAAKSGADFAEKMKNIHGFPVAT